MFVFVHSEGWEVQDHGVGRCGASWVPASWSTGYHLRGVLTGQRGRGGLQHLFCEWH